MKLKISENSDPNYLACVMRMPEIKKHQNAEKLEIVEIFGNTVVIGKDSYTVGEHIVYFPVESCLSDKFLSHFNLFDTPSLNKDGKTKSYFGKSRRVKAISLRGIPSQGFIFKVSELANYYNIPNNIFKIGDSFDMVGDDILVKKYIRNTKTNNVKIKKSRIPKWLEFIINKFPKPIRKYCYNFVNLWFCGDDDGIKSKILDGQFKFHYKTENLGRNINILKPDNFITVTSKLHGCVKYDTPIETLEYGVLPIMVIVGSKLDVHVKGYDIKSDEFKWVKVDEYFYKYDDGTWYEIELENGKKLTITGDNPVWLPNLQCYRKTENLKIGDTLLVGNTNSE